ncbi:MAG: two-component system, response regulator PdtaR [Chloroflexota bacterium]|jgi:response regulator NasT|nr:two-component system, response regulator PdtaR [Chloroflexota bacterium]
MAAARILIAEDEAIPRMGLRELLQDQGYEVVGEAADGHTAVELARKLRPDLVVMDVRMPEMDGITASRILSEERLAPVVLITAYPDHEVVARAKEAGVFSWVHKPFTENQLVPQIEIALARFAEFRALILEAGNARAALETRRIVERAKTLLMSVHGLSEADAYRRIQRISMNNRRSMREVADAILLTEGG